MDTDGYPDETELERIREWSHKDGHAALMAYVRERWWHPDWGWTETVGLDAAGRKFDGSTYHISTGGWSGNESLIGALEANAIFMAMCWVESRRGGHYVFEVRRFDRVAGSRPDAP